MNNENQDTQSGLREIATEIQRFRQAVLIGFAVVCLIAGLLLLCYPNYLVPMVVCFVATAGFIFWEPSVRIGRGAKRLSQEMREEVRRQHSSGHVLQKGQDGTHAA
jgi:Flp pilus assembly protein TadB